MDANAFTDLALRVLAGAATEQDHRALDTAMASSSTHREKFDQLKSTHVLFRTVAPMTDALVAKEPALPAYRLNELRTAVRQHFGPAAKHNSKETKYSLLHPALRWLLGGGIMTALALGLLLSSFSDRSIEVGLYHTDQLRGGDASLSPADVPMAHVITFDQDAPFDQWKKTLAWNQHAKIWIDNEKDLLHIVRRDRDGHLVEQTEPLAHNNREQTGQVSQAVESLQKR
ncbi:MAG TPA: hypothetical protein VGC39_09515 [Candidatus Methylacidiphilales bacterium]